MVHPARRRTGAPPVVVRLAALAAAAAALAAAPATARAQQTIFRNPSADVLPAGYGFFEIDTTDRFHEPAAGWEGLRLGSAWGTSAPLELGLNAGPFLAGDDADPLLVPHLKARLFHLRGSVVLSGLVGTRVHVPFRRGWPLVEGYAFVALRVGPLRVTGGGYVEGRARDDLRSGPVFSAEVFAATNLTLAVEWWRHRDLGVGLLFPLDGGVSLRLAYLFSPAGYAGDGLFAELGFVY